MNNVKMHLSDSYEYRDSILYNVYEHLNNIMHVYIPLQPIYKCFFILKDSINQSP